MKSSNNPADLVALFLLAGGLVGCGLPPVGPTGAADSLKGNWLVTGTVPTLPPTHPLPTQLGLTMTIDVVNGQVIAEGSEFYPCSTLSLAGAGVLFAPAPIAADGSFTLNSNGGIPPSLQLTIGGKTPATAGGDWSGTYSATNSNAGCAPFAGTFTAVPIQPVSGTFAGPSVLTAPNSALAQAVTLTVNLQQGGPASLDPPTESIPIDSVNALSGTIAVQGFSCFSSGTANIGSGYVGGDRFELTFMMNDGSQLTMIGYAGDTTVSSVLVGSLSVNGGSCSHWMSFPMSTLARQ